MPTPRRPFRESEPTAIPGVARHVERHFGSIDYVLQELGGRRPRISVHHVPPAVGRPFHTLVTNGMSRAPMLVPRGRRDLARAELFLLLPPAWKVAEGALGDLRWRWPARLLRELARYPHETGTWLGCGHTVSNGEPPRPYAEGVGFCASLLTGPISTSPRAALLNGPKGPILFYQVVPLFQEELRLAQQHSARALVARFAQYDVDDVIDPGRVNVGPPGRRARGALAPASAGSARPG